MADREEIVEIFSEFRNFADNDVHPVVSPENWHIYSKLRDLIDQAEEYVIALLKEQEAVEPKRHYSAYWCAKCGCFLSNIGKESGVNFCSECGQAVKWE